MRISEIILPSSRMTRVIGVIADTHKHQSSSQLNPRIFQILTEHRADLIFHLGDITTPEILSRLGEIAPVHAVLGNRDLGLISKLPDAIRMEVDGISIGLTHGHGPMPRYIWDKLHYYLTGFQFDRYRRLLDSLFPDCRVRLFGHTHVAFTRWIDGVLYFNPGAACAISKHDPHPSIGILTLEGPDHISAEVIRL